MSINVFIHFNLNFCRWSIGTWRYRRYWWCTINYLPLAFIWFSVGDRQVFHGTCGKITVALSFFTSFLRCREMLICATDSQILCLHILFTCILSYFYKYDLEKSFSNQIKRNVYENNRIIIIQCITIFLWKFVVIKFAAVYEKEKDLKFDSSSIYSIKRTTERSWNIFRWKSWRLEIQIFWLLRVCSFKCFNISDFCQEFYNPIPDLCRVVSN